MSNENEILTIAGKLVKVAYCKHEEDACERCCLLDGKKCLGTMKRKIWDWPCMKFGNDQKNAYFVEAPQEKDYKKLYEELVNSEWYKKYYQGASVGDSVAVEQQEEEAPARPANPFIPDQGVTIDGKRYVKRYFRIGDACRRCAFKVGEDANGHAFCKDHGKPEKPCTPDREKGVLVYFIAADQLQEEIHSLQEWAKIMAERPDLRAEFDKMCPPQPIQGSIAAEADLDELIKQEMVKVYETYTRPDYIEENTTAAAYDFDTHIARHFYNLNPKHK